MKLLFLVACIGLASSASIRSGQLMARTPRELTYQYDAQIAAGIEEVSNEFSTVRMRFRVRMHTDGSIDGATGAEKWTLAFTDVSVRQRSNATEQLPKSLLPMEQFRNLESPELWSQAERTLKKPFAVLLRPRELAVVKVLFSESDPFWSVNIKKGFLSLLQLNFIPKDASAADMTSGQWTKETDEMTVAAVCKTFYSARKIEHHESDTPVFRVDKAVDFNDCLNPMDGSRGVAGMWNGLRHQESLPGQEDENLVSVNNLAQYLVDMGGDSASPVIRKASTRTVHILSTSKDSTHGSEKMFSVQKMKLLTGEPVAAPEEMVEAGNSLTEQPEGLRLIYPEEAKNVDREALMREVGLVFRSLWKSGGEVDMRSYEQIVRILRLYLKRVEDIEAVAQQLSGNPNRQRALRTFIMDICPQVASHGSIQFLMRIVQAVAKTGRPMEVAGHAQLTAYHIPAIFAKLSMTGKVQLRTLKAVFEVVKDEAFSTRMMTADNMPIFSAAWLSLGAMVNVYYGGQAGVEPYLHPLPESAAPWEQRQLHAASSDEFRRQFVAEVTEGLARSDAGRNLALKVTKNCGLFELYDQIGPMIRKRDSRAVAERVQAVYATRNMLHRNTLQRLTAQDALSTSIENKYIRDDAEYRRHFETISSRIQADLVTCFRNVREDPELRIACYRVLMQCPYVKQSVLNMLVQAILSEPTQQVYAYCVSHMAQIASSSLPRYQRVRQTVSSALSMLKSREPLEQVHSRVFHGQLWDELHQLGFTVEADMIVSDKSFVPRWTHIRIGHQAMGQNVPVLEIGLRTQGLQGLLDKVFGPRGLIYKSGSVLNLLRRSPRSLDASIDAELLDILPRMLAEVANMDLTVGLMGYDVIYVQNCPEVSSAPEGTTKKVMWKLLSSVGKVMQPFAGLFTINANYEMPTPAGTILDLNCFMTLDFWPKVTLQKEMSDSKAKFHVKASVPFIVKGFKRFGSNMFILNHYHQWLTSLKVNQQSEQEYVIQVDLTNPKNHFLSFLWSAPGASTPILQFKNALYSTFTESLFQEGRIKSANKNSTIVHRQIQQQRTNNYSPILGNLLAPFGYNLQVTSKYFTTRHLYKAPCSLMSGPAEYTVYLKPTSEVETERAVFVSSKLEIVYPEVSGRVPQVKLQVNNVRIQSDGSEAVNQKLLSVTFKPTEWGADRMAFQCTLRYHLGLPSSYRASGYQLMANGRIEMPEDLLMTPKSLPLQSEEWLADRRLSVKLMVADEESEVADIEVQMSTNPELKKLLVDSDLSEEQMTKMFPELIVCLNETEQSIHVEPLTANPLFTPSCIRQFLKFNKLSQTKIQITRRSSWFLNPENSPLLDATSWKIQDLLQPYLAFSETPDAPEDKVTIVSCPSPVDMRVHHLNVTWPSKKSVWRSIQLPFVPFSWDGIGTIMTAANDYVKGGSSKCSLLHSHVRTFDSVIYSIPKSLFSRITDNQCPVLLAKDCSKAKEFQVLAHIKDGRKYITLQLNTDGTRSFVIEVSKPLNSDQKKSSVKVNGAELEHSEGTTEETEILRRTVSTEKGPVVVVISKYHYGGTIMYRVRSVQHQVQILLGGRKLRTVEIRVSPFYRNRLCGLCGDYNGEGFREFKGPNNHRVAASAQQMVQQYVLPVSDSCKMDKPDSWNTHGNEQYLPNYYSYKSIDLPRRRPSCQIVGSKQVKSFKHAEFEMISPALRQIIRDTACDVKLTVALLGDKRIRVYLRPSSSELLIKMDSEFQQRLSVASPVSSRRSASPLPSGLTAKLETNESGATFELASGGQWVTVKVTEDKRIVIKASQVDETEDAVCELWQPSQITPADGANLYETLKKFTNADGSPACRDQLKKRLNQCSVSPSRVQPFHRSGETEWWQPRYLNAQLRARLEESKAPLILSVDQIAEDASAISVQLVHEPTVRHVLLRKNRQTLVKISLPESGSPAQVTVAYRWDGSERSVRPASGQTSQEVEGNFRLVAGPERIKVAHQSSLYELQVQPVSGGQHEVTIVRSYAHPGYSSIGLCQVNRLSHVRDHHANPRAVLAGALHASLAESAASSIVTEEEIGQISSLLGELLDN